MDPDPDETRPVQARPAPRKPSRDERLKAALKANMARRKAQARAKGERGGAVRDGEDTTE